MHWRFSILLKILFLLERFASSGRHSLGLVLKKNLPEKHNIISHVGVGISVVLLSA